MKRIIVFVISIFFVSTWCGVYIFLCHSPRFNLTRIDIQGNHKVSEREILQKAKMELGTNIFRMDLDGTEEHIKEDKRIKGVRVKRKFPNQILIEVEEKKPALWINLPEGLYGLSPDQEIIPLEEEDFDLDLLVVSGLASLPVFGKKKESVKSYTPWPNRKAKFAFNFYTTLLEEDVSFMESISEINLGDETNLILYLVPGGTQVNLGKDGLKKKLRRLRAILRYEEKPEYLACIDLRFKDQVVLRKSSQGLVRSVSQDPNKRLVQMRANAIGREKNL